MVYVREGGYRPAAHAPSIIAPGTRDLIAVREAMATTRNDRAVSASSAASATSSAVSTPWHPGQSTRTSRLQERESSRSHAGILRVLLRRGYGLRPADSNGYSDPYVVLSCGGQVHVSRVVTRTLDPVWNQEFEFVGPLSDFHTSGLSLIFYDQDLYSKDDGLGHVHVSLMEIDPSERESTRPTIARERACEGRGREGGREGGEG